MAGSGLATHPGRTHMKSGLEIAQEAALRPVGEIAEAAGIEAGELELYGR